MKRSPRLGNTAIAAQSMCQRTYKVSSDTTNDRMWYQLTGPSTEVSRIHAIICAFYRKERKAKKPAALTAWLLDEISKPTGPTWSTRICPHEAKVLACYDRIVEVPQENLQWRRYTASDQDPVDVKFIYPIIGY